MRYSVKEQCHACWIKSRCARVGVFTHAHAAFHLIYNNEEAVD